MTLWMPVRRGRHVRHLLSDYIDGGLSPAAARQVERHLGDCPACAIELEQWRGMLQLISLHARVPCPIDCADAVLLRLAALPTGRDGSSEGKRTIGPARRLTPPHTLTRNGSALSPPASLGSLRRPLLPPVALSLAWATAAAALLLLLGSWRWFHAGRATQAYPVAGRVPAVTAPVPAVAPDRLDGAFGRSDSLILASDFAEEDQ